MQAGSREAGHLQLDCVHGLSEDRRVPLLEELLEHGADLRPNGLHPPTALITNLGCKSQRVSARALTIHSLKTLAGTMA